MHKHLLASILATFVIAFPAFSTAQQATLTEFPLPTSSTGSNPYGITPGPDGAVWFTAGSEIGSITSAGLITEFPVTNELLGNSINSGPDGALWFAEPQAKKIGRITTDGTITNEFPVPGQPSAVVAGPDGTLWFSEWIGETLTSKIAQMTTAGVVTNEYPVTSSPIGMTVGPDGAIWFAENNDLIGRITTSGALSEFAVPLGVNPHGIAAGPDGALWFTEFDPNHGNSIARMTPDGVLTNQYSLLPYGLMQPDGICLGPDGAIWFTAGAVVSGGGEHFGRITTSGLITVYTLPASPFPGAHAIASGADGALYLTEYVGNAIGRVVLDPDPPATNLSVANVGSPDPVEANENLTFTITVTNQGPADATGVTLLDPLTPAQFTVVSVTPSQGACTVGTTTVCPLGTIANGGSATVTVVVNQFQGGAENTATVTANETGQVPYTPSATANPTVLDNFNSLGVRISRSTPARISEGSTLTYSISVSNAGLLDATNVVLTDQFQGSSATVISEIPSQGTCTSITTCVLGTIPANNGATLTIQAVPTSVGRLVNSARVSEDQSNQSQARGDSLLTTVTASPDFTPVGSDVTVQPTDPTTGTNPVTITYDGVSTPGTTSVVSSDTGPPLPAGFSLGSPATYYELSTNSAFTGSVNVCFNYTGISFTGSPMLLHYESGNWVDITASVDTTNMIICGSVTSFSPFAIVQRLCTTAPTLNVSLSPNSLWPPNHKIAPITATVTAHDGCDPHPTVSLVSITANELLAPGDITGASYGTDDLAFGLAASRSGSGDGRVYTVTYSLTDQAGQSTTASATVTVAHDQGH